MISLKYHQETITAMKSTVRNWSEYNAGLKDRGSLTFWLDEAVLEAYYTTVIPPRKDAVIWQHGDCKKPPHPRDENLRYIRRHGRKK